MRQGTSGFWIEEKNGAMTIGYEDYGVEEFGGGDFERTYCLDKENTKKFLDALKKEYKGEPKEMIEAAFGTNFNSPVFWDFCEKNGIDYSSFTWCG